MWQSITQGIEIVALARERELLDIDFIHSHIHDQWPLLLTWFNFNPSMDK